VAVSFRILTYTVSASAGANGSIDPVGDITKDYGSSQLFTATPTTGYEVNEWKVDGGPVQSGGTTYTLSTITTDHTITVSFSKSTYTVSASAGIYGSIDPWGVNFYDYGSSQVFSAMPNSGYGVYGWYMDGNIVQSGGNTYTLSNITANHTVYVVFYAIPVQTDVNIAGTWAAGLSHAKEPGINRLLVFIAHGENIYDMNLASVTYGGQEMTKIMEYNYLVSTRRVYAVAFLLKEAGIAAASGNSFVPVWINDMNVYPPVYASVFLSNVNQDSPIGSTTTAGNENYTITAPALTVSGTSMAILAGTFGKGGAYTVNNGFTEGIDQINSNNTITGVTGHKTAAGATQIIPSITWSGSAAIKRQMLMGFEVRAQIIRVLTASTATGGSAILPGEGIFYYLYNTEVPIIAEAQQHYHFTNWSGTGVTYMQVADPYSAATKITMLGNYTITANFAIETRNVTITAGANGSVDPNGIIVVDDGDDRMFTASAEDGYIVDAWYLDGNSVQIGGDTYTLSNITADHTVSVTFGLPRVISGIITTNGSGLPDVNVDGLGVVTDINGFYTATVADGRSIFVTPVKKGWFFDPNGRSYINISGDYTDQNYTAELPADLDYNLYVDIYDLEILCENWLKSGDGDIDNNGIVDFLDFAEFALAW
jgi:hypothetical protein